MPGLDLEAIKNRAARYAHPDTFNQTPPGMALAVDATRLAAEVERLRAALNAVYNSVSLECPMPGPVFAKVMEALGLAKQ